MALHLCTGTECPYLGKPSAQSCACHQTDEQVLTERVAELVEALSEVLPFVADDTLESVKPDGGPLLTRVDLVRMCEAVIEKAGG